MGRRTSLRAEGMYFRGASMDVDVGVNVSARLGCERERKPDCKGGARLEAGVCVRASVAVAELAVGLDSIVPERSSREVGWPNCAGGIVWLLGRV